MTKDVEFYFDFGSPYSYLAYHQLQKIALDTGATIIYRPVIIGAIFKATHNQSPIMIPAKARYLMKDLMDWAKYWHIPTTMNPYFPINTFNLMRAAIGYQQHDAKQFERFIALIFKAMFEQPANLNDENVIKELLTEHDFSFEHYQQLIQDEKVKEHAKQLTQHSIEKGLFGVPAFFVDGEMFWGQDRLHFVKDRLTG